MKYRNSNVIDIKLQELRRNYYWCHFATSRHKCENLSNTKRQHISRSTTQDDKAATNQQEAANLASFSRKPKWFRRTPGSKWMCIRSCVKRRAISDTQSCQQQMEWRGVIEGRSLRKTNCNLTSKVERKIGNWELCHGVDLDILHVQISTIPLMRCRLVLVRSCV